MRLFLALLSILIVSDPSIAKSARCFTTDDGYYNCSFILTDGDGSFEIFGPNQPSYSLIMNGPDEAYISLRFGTNRSISLVGRFYKSKKDAACWVNEGLETKICAW